MRRSLAILLAALVSVLGATACAGADEQRVADLERRVVVLEEMVEELAEEEFVEEPQQEQTQERTQERTQ